jgi:hypothetical protein
MWSDDEALPSPRKSGAREKNHFRSAAITSYFNF